MKKILMLFLCITLLCGCSIEEIHINAPSNNETQLNSSVEVISSNDSSTTLPSKIYKAKNTTSYSSDLVFPQKNSSSTDVESYFYYKSLSENHKLIYNKLCLSIENMADGFIDIGYITDDDLSTLISYIKNDRPEYFWLGRDYIINTKEDGYKQLAFKFKSSEYSIDYLYSPSQRNEILSKIKSIISKIEASLENKNQFEKELYIHNYIIDNCNYDENALNNPNNHKEAYNICGALLQNKAVCEGYAKSIQLLNNYFGIKTTVVIGKSNNQNHMWNLVNIDDEYYHLDATFNDNGTERLYAYFNLTDTAINRSHQIDSSFYREISLPIANNLKMSYFSVHGSLIKDNPYVDISSSIENAILNKENSVDFGYGDDPIKIYKNNDDMLKDNIDIKKIINSVCKKNKLKVQNISLLFASNGNFKIKWEYL